MRPSLDAWTLGGWLALAAMLALASPGVKVVRADDAALGGVPVTSQGPVCSAEPGEPAEDVSALIESLRRQAAADAETDPAAGDLPVVLNNRGYNYGPPPAIDPTLFEIEYRRQAQ